MLLRETIRKTKLLLHKSLRNLKSLIFGGYQKLPRSLSFNPFLGRSNNATRAYTSDQFYNEFYEILQSDLNRRRIIKRNNENSSTDQEMGNASKLNLEDGVKEKKSKLGNSHSQLRKKEDLNDLAQKMRELEMMDSGDVEHVLDIEEALHYYSRLTSPVYLDIVDKFFTDMHSEFSVPQSSVKVKRSKSKGRLASIRF